jgi:uncharacterized protein YndB with AHSA1/START domain
MREGRIVVRYTRACAAPPDAVFALLRDSSTYPSWSSIGGYEMEEPGAHERHGVGELRVFTFGPVRVRERIVELVPGRMMAYTLLSGLPMRDYRGETTLEPTASGGTRIVWQSSFRGVAGTGWFMRLFMRWTLFNLTTALTRAAEAQSLPMLAPQKNNLAGSSS